MYVADSHEPNRGRISLWIPAECTEIHVDLVKVQVCVLHVSQLTQKVRILILHILQGMADELESV